MTHFSPLKKISLLILFLHLFVFTWAILLPNQQNKKKHSPIVVRSIIEEKKPIPAVIKPANSKPSPAIKQKKQEPTPVKRAPVPKPKEVKKITKSLSKPKGLASDDLFIPKLHDEIKPSKLETKTEKISFDEILQFLESMIVLPLKSAVKAKMTIQPDGKIKDITILEGENENKNYLIQTLEGYLLPIDNTCEHERELIINFRGL